MNTYTIEAPALWGVKYVYTTAVRPFAWFTSEDDAVAFLALLADTEPQTDFEVVRL